MFCTGTACTFAQFPPPSNTFMTRGQMGYHGLCGPSRAGLGVLAAVAHNLAFRWGPPWAPSCLDRPTATLHRLSSPLPQACGTPSTSPATGVAQTGLAVRERGSGARQTPGGGRSPAHSPTEGTGGQHSGGWQGGGADSIPWLLGAPGGAAHLARRPPAHLEALRQTPAAAWSGGMGAGGGWRRLGGLAGEGRAEQHTSPCLAGPCC